MQFNRGTLFFLLAAALAAPAQTGTPVAELENLDSVMTRILAEWKVPGGALAVAREGRLVYARGFGLADVDAVQAVEPNSLFRVASLSKPITAAAILRLVQERWLDLDAIAFDILSDLQPPPGREMDPRIRNITIRHLLTHTAGWNVRVSGNVVEPPMTSRAAETLGVPEPADAEILIRYMLGQPLDFTPGTYREYSNFGYCILGRIIEKITGERYDSYTLRHVLGPAGISRMFITRPFLEDRADGEVRYYSWPGEHDLIPSAYPDRPGMFPPHYGGVYVDPWDSLGGWVGSPIDLVRFAVALDRQEEPLLSSRSLELLKQRPDNPRLMLDANEWYGLGWTVEQNGSALDLYQGGILSGARAYIVKGANGVVWAVAFNSGRIYSGDNFLNDASRRLETAIQNIGYWPDHDLFSEYYPTAPRFAATGVQNAASYSAGPIAAGERIVISGAALSADESTRVLFDSEPAQVVAAAKDQIIAVVPDNVRTEGNIEVRVEREGATSEPVHIAAAIAAPGVFTASGTGRGQAVAINEDGSANTTSNPCAKGATLTIKATGVLSSSTVSTVVGTRRTDDISVAPAGPGLVLITFRIPDDAPSGPEVPLMVIAGERKSRTGVTVAIN